MYNNNNNRYVRLKNKILRVLDAMAVNVLILREIINAYNKLLIAIALYIHIIIIIPIVYNIIACLHLFFFYLYLGILYHCFLILSLPLFTTHFWIAEQISYRI